jgi:hypothetical protein
MPSFTGSDWSSDVCSSDLLAFLQWLFGGKDFSHGKAVVFVVMMFLFGSVFFFK